MKEMIEVRAAVDTIDKAILDLIKHRFDLMEQAANIKPTREAVLNIPRKELVISNAVKYAAEVGIPGDSIGLIWETLVNACIAHEYNVYDRLTDAGQKSNSNSDG